MPKDQLKEYKKKRNFAKTPEPKPKKKSSSKRNIYSIQEHDASHLHYDLRLEKEGVLKSWAIPKSPPKKSGIKRLAIQTEDHPLDYWNFEGEISEGYGAGTVKLWDKGTYEVKEWGDKKIEIIIKGKKLEGEYVLVKTRYGSKPEKSWLFFKAKGD